MKIDYKEFTQRWVKNLIESIDVHLDEETKIRLMESCGRPVLAGDPFVRLRHAREIWMTGWPHWRAGTEEKSMYREMETSFM